LSPVAALGDKTRIRRARSQRALSGSFREPPPLVKSYGKQDPVPFWAGAGLPVEVVENSTDTSWRWVLKPDESGFLVPLESLAGREA
jgi:hypothetical protein